MVLSFFVVGDELETSEISFGDQFGDRHLAAKNVLLMSMVTVMGPTPPGTGVMAPATSFTPKK